MKTIITTILLILSTLSFSQNCKYKINDVDKFTGKITKLTKAEKIFENSAIMVHVSVQKIDNNYSLILVCEGSFYVLRTIKPNSELLFLLENSKIITLKEKDGVFPIKSDELKELMKSKSKTLRFTLETKEGALQKEGEIKNGDAIRFTNLIKCIL